MMKKTFQWIGALALIVMGALAIVGCSDNDNDNNGGGNGPVDPKLVGTWVLSSIDPDNGHGPQVGFEMTFKSDGTFSADNKNGTFSYDGKKFKAKLGNMSMDGEFEVDGNTLTGTVKVTENGQSQTYDMTFQKKGTQPTVSSIKMVGTWKVMIDGGGKLQVGRTATFDDQGNCTIGENDYTYTCEEEEGGRLAFKVYDDGGECVIEGWMVLVNAGNVLNGQYYGYYGNKAKTRAVAPAPLVLKKPGYSYPTEGVKGRWTMTFVGQAFGGYDDSFAERLPVSSKEEVFVIDEDGGLYVEGDPHVGSYIDRTNALDLQFAGKYTARITGQITFSSGGNIINQSGGGISFSAGSSIGFKGTYQRVESLEDNSDAVKDDRILGSWYVTMDEGTMYWQGSTFTFYADGTWTGGWMNGYFSSEVDDEDARRICFKLYSDERELRMDGKLVKVSGGNVLTGEYSFPAGEKAKTRGDGEKTPHYGIAMKKPDYEYPSGGIKGRWEMTACSLGENAPIGNVLVFENDTELYIEGDPHVGTYSKTNSNLMMTFGDDSNTTISGTVTISGTTASLTNAKLSRNGQQVSSGVTATLVKQ